MIDRMTRDRSPTVGGDATMEWKPGADMKLDAPGDPLIGALTPEPVKRDI